jgi:hypothetical protein
MAILTVSMRGGKRTLQATQAEWNDLYQRLAAQESNRVRPNTELLDIVQKAARTRPASTITVSSTVAAQLLDLNS